MRFKKYKDWSIQFKLLTISTLLILCSVSLVSLLSYIQYTRDFEKQSADRIQQTIEQVSLNLDVYIDDLFRLSISPYYNNSVMAALEDDTGGSEIEQLEKSRLIEDFLDQMMITPRKDIMRVFLLTSNIYSGSRTRISINTDIDFHSYKWYEDALKSHDPIFVPVHMEQMVRNSKNMVFSVVSQLRSTRYPDKILGVIKVDANYSGIRSICNRVNLGKEGRLFIIDGSNNIIYPDNVSLDSLDTDIRKVLSEIHSRSSQYKVNPGKNEYLVNTIRIDRSSWTIAAVNSVSELNSEAARTRNMAFSLAFVFSLLTILVFVYFSRRFLNPLLAIVKLMKEVQHGNLNVRFQQQFNDEIGYLGSSFNSMIAKISDMLDQNVVLIKQVYEAKLLQKEAQFNALYSQIKPHFIYNALNMISLSMQLGKYDNAVDNINKLSSLMRGIANIDKEIPLEKEINLLDSYLSIQRSRYEGRMEYFINIDEDLYSYYIPSLLLQPAVENSVVHGCENKKGKTTIRVFDTIENENIVFHIQDDGNGMSEEQVRKLQEQICILNDLPDTTEAKGKRSGMGLVNVNKRIKIKYGDGYGLFIDSKPGAGTCVRIVLPLHLSREMSANV